MQIRSYNIDRELAAGKKFFWLTDWYSLAPQLGVKVQTLAYTLRTRQRQQRRMRQGKRIVYNSGIGLKFVQRRIALWLDGIFAALPKSETAHLLSYIPGLKAADVLRALPPADTLVMFDVRHYYDNLPVPLIEQTLTRHGLPKSGARLIARYCTVHTGHRQGGTLQQGSNASPVLSNLLGLELIDKPVRQWLRENVKTKHTYLRYCDNIALFLHEPPEPDIPQRFKAFVKQALQETGLKTHKWSTVRNNHPKINQHFLGVVLNAMARVELSYFDKYRAMLFRACVHSIAPEAARFYQLEGLNIRRFLVSDSDISMDYVKHLRGHTNYIKSVSPKQGLMLEKLLAAALRIRDRDGSEEKDNWYASYIRKYGRDKSRDSEFVAAIKTYKRHNESLDDYIARIDSEYEEYKKRNGL